MNYNSRTAPGRDYSAPLVSLLPTIIGKRAKCVPRIAELSGRSRQTVDRLMKRLLATGQVHIKRWKRGETGPYVAYYFWGRGKNAVRPAAMTNSEKHKRYRMTENGAKVCKAIKRRWKRSDRGREYRSNYEKAKWARQKFSTGGIAAIDPLLAAVMGRQSNKEQTCI